MLIAPACPTNAFDYDPGRTGQSDYTGPSKAGLSWKKTIGPSGFSYIQPVVGKDARVYVHISSDDMSTSGVVSLAPDGKELWRYEIKPEPDKQVKIYSLAISPDNTNIYLLVRKDSATIVVCLNSLNGIHRWSLNMDGWPPHDSAMVFSRDGAMYFANSLGVYGVSQEGRLIWKWLLKDTPIPRPEAVFSRAISPDGETLYLIIRYTGKEKGRKDFFIGAIDTAQGRLKWQGDYPLWKFPDFEGLAVDPKTGTIYTGGLGDRPGIGAPGFLYAFNPDGSLKWRYEVKKGGGMGSVFPSVGRDGTVYITTGQDSKSPAGLIAVGPDGRLKWRYAPAETYWLHNPVLIDKEEKLYFLFNGKDRSHDGLYCIDKNGKLIFRSNIKENFWGFSPVLSPDGAIYFTSTQGTLYAFK